MDFFTVPTITFSVLYCFFVISHDRRRIRTSMSPSIRQACGSSSSCEKHFHLDPLRGSSSLIVMPSMGLEVPTAVRSLRVNPVRTSFESPWQNGVAERWVGSCRRDLLDHIIAVDERHLKRLLSEYIRYYREDRTHLGLGKGNAKRRTRSIASVASFLICDWEGCTTGMIGLPNPDQRSVAKTSGFPHPYIYTYTARAFFRERFLALEGEG